MIQDGSLFKGCSHAKEDRIVVKNVGGMTEIICHGAGRKDLKPKEAERCENMDGVKKLKILIWLKWRLN